MKAAHFDEINEETLAGMMDRLENEGWFMFRVHDARLNKLTVMVVLALPDEGNGPMLMFAHEGGGCAFVTPDERMSGFKFIQRGFAIKPANVANRLLQNLVAFRSRPVGEPFALLEAPISN